MNDLRRFVDAQSAGVYETALRELREGAKRGHWIWFIFPQIAGLGHSEVSRHFSLAGVEEATAYVNHPLLGPRLVECVRAMLAWGGERNAQDVLGMLDARKFQSSMTLFEVAATDPRPFSTALDVFFAGRRDDATMERV